MKQNVVVIHQPDFLPYMGFFHRLLKADTFIILNHVQMSKRGWVHRDKIKTPSGEEWISLPIKKLAKGPIISEAEIDYENAYDKIARMIQANYQKAAFFSEIFPTLSDILAVRPPKLYDLNLLLLKQLFTWFDIQIPTFFSHELGVTSTKSLMNAELTKKVGGTTYLSGVGAKDYHNDAPFAELGVSVEWQEFNHPEYTQLHDSFIPYLSSIDLLLNCGIKHSREILRSTL